MAQSSILQEIKADLFASSSGLVKSLEVRVEIHLVLKSNPILLL